MRKVKDVLDVHLREQRTGKPMRKETVRDFIRTYDKNLTPDSSVLKLNRGLRECGLVPIRFRPDRTIVITILLLVILVLGNTLLPFHRLTGIILLTVAGLSLLTMLFVNGLLPEPTEKRKK